MFKKIFKTVKRMFGLQKPVERVCGNCKLYNPRTGLCSVFILHEGEKTNIPVEPQDSCFFEQEYFDPVTNERGDLNAIQEVKIWAEDEHGNKGRTGKIKIEYPEGFFPEIDLDRTLSN